jgi:hypothetical protein
MKGSEWAISLALMAEAEPSLDDIRAGENSGTKFGTITLLVILLISLTRSTW